MPCLSGKFNPTIGIIINVGVLQPGVLTPTTAQNTQIVTFPALVDTGASSTCIAPTIVQALGLRPSGKRPMVSATHVTPVNVYFVDLVMPFGKAAFHVADLQVMEFVQAGSGPYQMLLGRDVICQGVLTLGFDGHFSFSL